MNPKVLSHYCMFLGTVGVLLGAVPRLASAQAAPDVVKALPSPTDLPGFTITFTQRFKPTSTGSQECILSAQSNDDVLRLKVDIAIADSVEHAAKAASNSTIAADGPFPPCSHTGRRFGDEIWHTVEPDGGPDRLGFTLVTRMDRAIVTISVAAKVIAHTPIDKLPLVDEADMRLTEDLTICCLKKLVGMRIGTIDKATPIEAPPVSDVLREVIAPVGQTPGYSGVRYKKGPGGNDEIEITRKRDGMRMPVHLSISSRIQDAITMARSEASSRAMSENSLTGHLVGNEVWHRIGSEEKGRNSFSLLTRMGPAVLRVEVTGRSAAGRGATAQIPDPDDVQIAEEITVGCLNRLAAKGIGTKMVAWLRPPLPKPDVEPGDK